MHPDGYWVKPGPGYSPKYTSTVWALILLAQLGASVHFDERIARACGYILDFGMTPRVSLQPQACHPAQPIVCKAICAKP